MENKTKGEIEAKCKDKKVYANILDLIIDLASYKCVINVRSEDEAEEFVRIMRDRFDMGWEHRDYKLDYFYMDETCYCFHYGRNSMTFGSIKYFKFEEGKDVIPYSDVRELLVNGSIYNNHLNSDIESKSEKEML